MKYTVTLVYDASESITVDADTPDDAVEQAYKEAQAMVCCHCSKHLELGDVYKELVYDEEGNEITETSHDPQ